MVRLGHAVLASIVLVSLLLPATALAESALANCKYYTKTQGEWEQAVPYCLKCMEEEPENPETYYYAGWALREAGRFDEAWEANSWLLDRIDGRDKKTRKLAKKVEDQLQNTYARAFNGGIQLLEKEDNEGAMAAFLHATRVYPIKVDAYLNLAFTQAQLGEKAAALESYRSALRVEPENLVALERTAWTLVDAWRETSAAAAAGDSTAAVAAVAQEARDILKRVIALNPESDRAYATLAEIEFDAGNLTDALVAIRKAIQMDRQNVVSLYNVAVGFYQADQYAAAAAAFGAVADELKGTGEDLWSDALYNRGICFLYQEQFADCVQSLLPLVEANREVQDYYRILARAYSKMGLKQEASEMLLKFQELEQAKEQEQELELDQAKE
ncbi:MAG: tetratricopeptide repeat protein [Gemmatimonadota bacterium]|nr:tetratricopeptide repeat protein [Gemmatimonadota bacterium]